MKNHRRLLLSCAIAGFAVLTAPALKATPYASEVTNNAGTIQFYLNESGGNVTVTYEDGSTNENFNGITTGTNLAAGPYSFGLLDNSINHTSYTISVYKVGTGVPSLVPTPFQTPHTYFFSTSTLRDVDVNKNAASPNFGKIYVASASAVAGHALFCLNADGSAITNSDCGVTWSYYYSPYRITVAPDDTVLVGNYASSVAGIYRIAPDLSTNQLLLGPLGDQVTNSLGQIVHGLVFSRPLITGPLTNNESATLMEIDNDFPSTDPNAILVYTNVTTNSLPYEMPPAYVGGQVGLNIQYLGNVYPGLTQGGTNHYIYASNFRNNFAVPTVDVFDSTGTNELYNSLASASGPDVFVTSDPQSDAGPQGPIDSAVSPDGNYFVALAIDNHLTVCSCTNGIPNGATARVVDTLYDKTYYENARGMCFDAADNIYLVSSGTALSQSWTLGLTTTAITTGNASGATGFLVSYPVMGTVSVDNSQISQPNTHGNPTTATFTITLSSVPTNSVTVNYTFSGTALGVTNGGVIYPTTFAANPPGSVTFAPGQTQATVTVTAPTDSVSRPTTSLTLTLLPSGTFDPAYPSGSTISILNTGPQELFVTQGSPTMYNAFSNDYCSVSITRWGDINAAAYTVSSFSVGGNAVEGTDYTVPSMVTIKPGDTNDYSYFYPLASGQLPVHTNVMTYTGNKTVVFSIESTGSYTVLPNTNDFMIVDAANPPAPVLYSDPLTNAAPTNWIVRATDESYPSTAPDYFLDYGYNVASAPRDPNVPISAPPNGQATALRITSGKGGSLGNSTTYSTAVNLYLTNVVFSGDYAVRFNMNVTEPNSFATSGSFEGPLFGIDCSGNDTNWYCNSSPSAPANAAGSEKNWAMDGVWIWLTDDASYQYDTYTLFVGAGATNSPNTILPAVQTGSSSFVNNFKANIFSSPGAPGLPANGSPDNSFPSPYTNSWADVEIKQYNSVIALYIDKTLILSYLNPSTNNSGTVMLGYETPVFGGDGPDGAVYYSGLTVVQLTPPAISGAAFNSATSTYTFNFTTPDGDLNPASFTVMGSTNLLSGFTPVSGATVTQMNTPGSAEFQATVPASGPYHFYRIQAAL